MTISKRMEEDRSHVTERILNLTLEIIYLLTGESFPLLKSGDHVIITVPPCDSLKLERPNMEKILKATKRMMELLTGEVPIRCQDVTVYFSMEEWEYLEGHKDLYKDVMMEDEPDGSRKRNPPQRCPRPLEDCSTPHHDENENFEDCNIIIKQEVIMSDEEYGVMNEFNVDHEDQYEDIMMETPGNMNPPERCPLDPGDLPIPLYDQMKDPRGLKIKMKQEEEMFVNGAQWSMAEEGGGLLYSWDPIQDYRTFPHHDQGEGMSYVRRDQRCTEPAGIKATGYPKESFVVLNTAPGHDVPKSRRRRRRRRAPFPEFITENNDAAQDSSLVNNTARGHDVPKSRRVRRRTPFPDYITEYNDTSQCSARVDASPQPLHPSVPKTLSIEKQKTDKHKLNKIFPCPECGKTFSTESYIAIHLRTHTGKRPFVCATCGKSFTYKSSVLRHQRHHSEVRPHPCSHCGKCFKEKSVLRQHLRSHTGERPYPCPECGQRFNQKEHLHRHLRVHTGETPFACKECGRGFVRKDMLALHERRHTNERPFSCAECGNCFTNQFSLARHQKLHTKKSS